MNNTSPTASRTGLLKELGVKVLSFDLDGCLWEPNEAMMQSIFASFDAEDKRGDEDVPRPTRERMMQAIALGGTMDQNFRRIMEERKGQGNVDEEQIARLDAGYVTGLLTEGYKHFHLFEDVEDTLSALTESGVWINALSNKPEVAIRKALEHLGLLKYFKFAYGRLVHSSELEAYSWLQGKEQLLEDKKLDKPHGTVFTDRLKPAYAELGMPDLRADEVIVIGDTGSDKNFAKNMEAAGFIWTAFGDGKPSVGEGATATVQSFGELATVLL